MTIYSETDCPRKRGSNVEPYDSLFEISHIQNITDSNSRIDRNDRQNVTANVILLWTPVTVYSLTEYYVPDK